MGKTYYWRCYLFGLIPLRWEFPVKPNVRRWCAWLIRPRLVSDIRPCPFCGREAFVHLSFAGRDWRVRCSRGGCGGEIGGFLTKFDAIAGWNKREGT